MIDHQQPGAHAVDHIDLHLESIVKRIKSEALAERELRIAENARRAREKQDMRLVSPQALLEAWPHASS